MSQATAENQWPPRSPREALLSTPGGRQRYREFINRTSPSPQPRRSLQTAQSPSKQVSLGKTNLAADEDDDEETLQLKLQEIQARLKLKKLQAARARESATSQADSNNDGPHGQPSRRGENFQVPSRSTTQVPASPVRKPIQEVEPRSPSRVLLGIDKGLTAKDVSLKRASSLRRPTDGTGPNGTGGYLRRSRTPGSVAAGVENERPLSFNERLASARAVEGVKAARKAQAKSSRTMAFGLGEQDLEEFKKSAVEFEHEPQAAPSFSREDILSSKTGKSTNLRRSNTAEGMSDLEATSFEPYSCFHLSRRILPHRVLTRQITGKSLYSIKDLLKAVKSPDYELPETESDVVLFAIIAKKSDPRSHKPAGAKEQGVEEVRNKYMVISLSDLDFEVDLFLFNTGFERFWKLTEGTVVAILNPGIMQPPPGRAASGRFNLVVNSDEDMIIEIGTARDHGYCKSIKKDGNPCGSWVNKQKTEHCEFHSNEAIRKQRGARMELNGTGLGRRKHNQKEAYARDDPSDRSRKNYDWATKTHWFAARTMSTADLIDGKDRGFMDRKEKAESVKRSLEAKEKETEMMRKLSRSGNSAGREYMERAAARAADLAKAIAASEDGAPPPASTSRTDDAMHSLDLDRNKDRVIHLSPIKRKRPEGSLASSEGGGLGWGGGLRSKLAKMKEGQGLSSRPEAQSRKKTRFMTEKGIREAGRESLGAELIAQDAVETGVNINNDIDDDDNDDDDELVILK